MKFDNYMILEFPSKSSNEAFARSAVSCFAAQMDPTIEELGDIRTAVSEAVTNAIVHGYPNGLGTITLRCRILKDNVLDIVIKDKGVGISDIEQARQPMFTTGGNERAGLGFAVMQSFMDKVKVASKPNKGTTVTMEKYIIPRLSSRG
jgi:stage II sporulation protein AB (anti-sigma F factor)